MPSGHEFLYWMEIVPCGGGTANHLACQYASRKIYIVRRRVYHAVALCTTTYRRNKLFHSWLIINVLCANCSAAVVRHF